MDFGFSATERAFAETVDAGYGSGAHSRTFLRGPPSDRIGPVARSISDCGA
jgi:hypothetical protein